MLHVLQVLRALSRYVLDLTVGIAIVFDGMNTSSSVTMDRRRKVDPRIDDFRGKAPIRDVEVARLCGVEVSTVRKWRLLGRGPRYRKVGRCVRYDPDDVMAQFKSWCTRRLKEYQGSLPQNRQHWWTEGGSKRYLNDDASLEAAVRYVKEAQDRPH